MRVPSGIKPDSSRHWINVCIQVDRTNGLVKSSVNGETVATLKFNFTRNFGKLNITAGVPLAEYKTEVSDQFQGLLTNFNIFTLTPHRDIQEMSSSLCSSGSGDYFSWEQMEWIKNGELLESLHIGNTELCGDDHFFSLPLPTTLQWMEARYLCHLLSQGQLAEIRSDEELRSVVELSNPWCYYLWTPYTDHEEEGKFLSVNDGELISQSLPWNAAEEPSTDANYVAAYIRANRSIPTLFSVEKSQQNCAVCNISKVRH